MQPYVASRHAVRRFLLEQQGLTQRLKTTSRKASLTSVEDGLKRLECVQIDPVTAVERNQHLVFSSRLRGYRAGQLDELLAVGRTFEDFANAACIIPMRDYPMFEWNRRRRRQVLRAEMDKYGDVVAAVRARLATEGALPARAFASTHRVHGYWDNKAANTKATSHALNLLMDAGEIRVVRREGNVRFFDEVRTSVPKPLLEDAERIAPEEASAALVDKYLRAYRIADLGDPRFGWQHLTAAERREAMNQLVRTGAVVPVQVDDVRRPYYVLAEDLDRLRGFEKEDLLTPSNGPVLFLPPLDNLLWRRDRLVDVFGFSYTWEMYTPASKRRFGYYAMPILAGEFLIGQMDSRLDRQRGKLAIQTFSLEPGVRWTKSLAREFGSALSSFAALHGAEDIEGMHLLPNASAPQP